MPTDPRAGDAAGRYDASIASVRAELRDDSAWVAVARPRLSWTVATDQVMWEQAWAEVRCGDEIVRLESAESVLVPWPFAPLAPGDRRRIAVRAASTQGTTTEWSRDLAVDAAFTADWTGRPIALADPDAEARPVLLRRTVEVVRPLKRALLFHSALGFADYAVNGAAVDDGVLSPTWTSYRLRLVHETSDVTALLRMGTNALTARLAGGWFTEKYHVLTRPKRFFGDQPRLVAQLRLEYDDGSVEVIPTDDTWRAIADPVTLASGVYDGEHADARGEIEGWDAADFDDSTWPHAVVTDDPVPTPEARMSPPAVRWRILPPLSVSPAASGAPILDFGQNLVGRLRIRVRGAAGTILTLRHAEVLDEGELALRPLRLAKATDSYTLQGGGEETWEPRFTFHGFRYAQIDGWPGEFDPRDVDAVVIATDMPQTGTFKSSDERLNRFHENVVWTARGNYIAVPMDCPQRDERLGWTGDTQLFAPTAAFLFDCEAFLLSWMRDLALEQEQIGTGVVPLFAPNVLPDFANRGPIAAWGDAIAIVPRVLTDSTGDLSLLSEFYPAMRKWCDALLRARDDDGLLTAGRQLGDWLDPNAPPNAPARGRTDTDLVSTAYVVKTLRIVADIAASLGDSAEAERLAAAAEVSRRAFVDTFITPAGRMMCDTQTAYAVAIAFDLIDDSVLRKRVGDRLAEVVRRDGYHIATGLIGTSVVSEALTATGHINDAERLLLQGESPSWLYPVSVGATTVWERWDGLKSDGSLNTGAMVSFNHVALGSVAAWLHERVAGLTSEAPGYRRIRIAPVPLRGLSHARVRHVTPYGPAESGWTRNDGDIRIHAVVPPNTQATVILPGGATHHVASGTHVWDVTDTAPRPRAAVTLDSSMADLAEDPEAYAQFYAALEASPNRFVANAVRANAIYRSTLRIRDALVFADAATLDSVATAFARGSSS
jgi:alpha-L-rhamnosidase